MSLKDKLKMNYEIGMSLMQKWSCVFLILLGFGLVGCTPPADPMLDMLETDLKKTKVDDLSRTMDFVFSEVRFEQKEFKDKLSSGLNRWISYSDEKLARVTWTADELSQPLLDSYCLLYTSPSPRDRG